MYIQIRNSIPTQYSIAQLRNDYPQVSFPKTPSEALLAEYGVYPVKPTERPEHSETEVVEDGGYLQLEDSSWAQAWVVRPMNEEELAVLAQRKDAQRKAAYQEEADPLFFKWQRGEATQLQWLEKIAEIKLRYPD
jgi:hypothetical protein